jgi:hypothetical protein
MALSNLLTSAIDSHRLSKIDEKLEDIRQLCIHGEGYD